MRKHSAKRQGDITEIKAVSLLLDKGYEVKCVDNFHKGQCDAIIPLATNPRFEFEYGDVTVLEQMKEAVRGCDAIIHLAAIVGFPACKSQPALATEVNVEGTRNMLFARESYNPKMPFVCVHRKRLRQSRRGLHRRVPVKRCVSLRR